MTCVYFTRLPCVLGLRTRDATHQSPPAQPRDVRPVSSPLDAAGPLGVVGVLAAKHEATDEEAAAADQRYTQDDVDQGRGPEGEQVERPVAVLLDIRRVLVEVWLEDGVDPHVTCDKPAEEEDRGQRVPDFAGAGQRGGGLVFPLLGARQAGDQTQHQTKDPHHYQVDGDVGVSRTLLQVHRPDRDLGNGDGTEQRLANDLFTCGKLRGVLDLLDEPGVRHLRQFGGAT